MWEISPSLSRTTMPKQRHTLKTLSRILTPTPRTAAEQPANWDMIAPTTWQTWAMRSENIYKIFPVPLLLTRKEQQTLLPTSAKCQGQRVSRSTASLPRSSSSPTPLHFYRNLLPTRRITVAELTVEDEMVAMTVVLEVDANSVPSETWAATAGRTDIIQLAQSTTATPAPTKRMGIKTAQLPQIAWAAPFMAAGKQGQAFPAGPLQL